MVLKEMFIVSNADTELEKYNLFLLEEYAKISSFCQQLNYTKSGIGKINSCVVMTCFSIQTHRTGKNFYKNSNDVIYCMLRSNLLLSTSSRWHFEIFSPDNGLTFHALYLDISCFISWHFMLDIVSSGDSLQEKSNLYIWEEYENDFELFRISMYPSQKGSNSIYENCKKGNKIVIIPK